MLCGVANFVTEESGVLHADDHLEIALTHNSACQPNPPTGHLLVELLRSLILETSQSFLDYICSTTSENSTVIRLVFPSSREIHSSSPVGGHFSTKANQITRSDGMDQLP